MIASTLFLGGWGVPFAWFGWTSMDDVANWMNIAGPIIVITKMLVQWPAPFEVVRPEVWF
jgi:NADH-quinone oxidoreductase subunit H